MYYVIFTAIFVLATLAGIIAGTGSGGFMRGILVFAIVAIVLRLAMNPALEILMPESVREAKSRAASETARKDRNDAIMRMNKALQKNDIETASFWAEQARKYDSQIQGN